MTPPEGRPGLKKTQRPPLLLTRTLLLRTGSDARWKALFERADIVSEGAPSGLDPHRRYYGSTNIVLEVGPERPGEDLAQLTAVIARDPHARLRALRAARFEAAQRACGELVRMLAEVSVSACSRGVIIHVDVEGSVLPERRAAERAERKGATEGGPLPCAPRS
jgi:hypothetical protein